MNYPCSTEYAHLPLTGPVTRQLSMCSRQESSLPMPESSEDQQTERCEHQNDRDVGYQPLGEVVPEEQDVHADHDGYHREHVQHDAYLSSHGLVLHDGVGKRDGQR